MYGRKASTVTVSSSFTFLCRFDTEPSFASLFLNSERKEQFADNVGCFTLFLCNFSCGSSQLPFTIIYWLIMWGQFICRCQEVGHIARKTLSWRVHCLLYMYRPSHAIHWWWTQVRPHCIITWSKAWCARRAMLRITSEQSPVSVRSNTRYRTVGSFEAELAIRAPAIKRRLNFPQTVKQRCNV